MRREEFFCDQYNDLGDYCGRTFDTSLIRRIRTGQIPEFTDIEIAESICTLLATELIAYANGNHNTLDNDDIRDLILAGRAVCQRLRLSFPPLPFRDLDSFERFWKAEGMTWEGSWERRRNWVNSAFAPLDQQISAFLQSTPDSSLLRPIRQSNDPIWKVIDDEISHLRQRFTDARTIQDFNAVGLVCVRIQEQLGMIAFDPSKHLPNGEPVPHKGQTINKFTYIIDSVLVGRNNATLRGLMRKTVEYAQELKHATTPTRQEAAISCDTTLMLVSTIRNLVDPPT